MKLLPTDACADCHRFSLKPISLRLQDSTTPFPARINPCFASSQAITVATFTIDSRGVDSAGVQRGQRPNPETGPFYIEGAEPGDTLVVHLLRLETNRTTGFSASLLAPYTADPAFLRQDALREPKMMTWQIDKQKGIAYPDPAEFKGPRIELPLRPCWGCVGTAPDNKAAIPPVSLTTSAATWTTTAWVLGPP